MGEKLFTVTSCIIAMHKLCHNNISACMFSVVPSSAGREEEEEEEVGSSLFCRNSPPWTCPVEISSSRNTSATNFPIVVQASFNLHSAERNIWLPADTTHWLHYFTEQPWVCSLLLDHSLLENMYLRAETTEVELRPLTLPSAEPGAVAPIINTRGRCQHAHLFHRKYSRLCIYIYGNTLIGYQVFLLKMQMRLVLQNQTSKYILYYKKKNIIPSPTGSKCSSKSFN